MQVYAILALWLLRAGTQQVIVYQEYCRFLQYHKYVYSSAVQHKGCRVRHAVHSIVSSAPTDAVATMSWFGTGMQNLIVVSP